MIDVVRAEDRSDELLEEIVLLVGGLLRSDSAQSVGSVGLKDASESGGGGGDRLGPRCGATRVPGSRHEK